MSARIKMSREQIAAFLKDPDAIKTMERLLAIADSIRDGAVVSVNGAETPLPIGAGIIESGSNANGSYVKYGDGTMMQMSISAGVTLSLDTGGAFNNYTGIKTITFPNNEFKYTPVITATVERYDYGSYGSFVSIHDITLTTFGLRETSCASQAADWYHWIAIGRWRA